MPVNKEVVSANRLSVCSPSILRTVRWTIIRFLIELLVRRTCFGQFDELYFVLNWLKSSQYTFIIPHRIIELTTMSFWVSQTRLRLPQVNKLIKTYPKRVKYLATPSSIFIIFLPHSQKSSALSQSGAMFAEVGEYSKNMLCETFWTLNIASSQFDK